MHRRHGAIEVQDFTRAAHHLDILAGVAPVVGERIVERRLQAGAVTEQRDQRTTDQGAPGKTKEIFGGAVGIAHRLRRIEEEHRRGQMIEAGKRCIERRFRQCRSRRELGIDMDALFRAGEFLVDRLDVALVLRHFVTIGLQALLDLLVIFFVAQANAFLLGELLLASSSAFCSLASSCSRMARRSLSRAFCVSPLTLGKSPGEAAPAARALPGGGGTVEAGSSCMRLQFLLPETLE